MSLWPLNDRMQGHGDVARRKPSSTSLAPEGNVFTPATTDVSPPMSPVLQEKTIHEKYILMHVVLGLPDRRCADFYRPRGEHARVGKIEITLRSQRQYDNAYTDVEVWVDLTGTASASCSEQLDIA